MYCTNPDNVNGFGTIFPNLNFFASICAARPVHIQSDQYRSCSTVKQWRAVGAAPFQKQRRGSELVKWHEIYTPEECADEWRQNNVDLKLLENCVMNGFIMCGIMFMTDWRIRHSHLTSTLFHSLVPWWRPHIRGESGPRELVSVNWRTPQWARDQFTRTITPDWFEKWRDIKFRCMC